MNPPDTPRPKPVVLCILDGWGLRDAPDDNAIAAAHTPCMDALTAQYPMSGLEASEHNVGLPGGQMGNSEVGHMNIGSGRVVMQDLPRIDTAIADGSLAANPALTRFIASLRQSGGTAHVMGLLSDGGVHAHQTHLRALVDILKAASIPVAVHAFLDGRDTPPQSAKGYVEAFGQTDIATLSGRYFAMDRDQRWERVQAAYDAIVRGKATRLPDALSAIDTAYAEGTTDEFIAPHTIDDYAGMRDGDGLLMANFRADRARQILAALCDPDFSGFDRGTPIAFASKLGMVEYSSKHAAWLEALFPPQSLTGILGEVVAEAGMKQLRIAETEKYAHVTFFFNGGREEPFTGEDRILAPSPKVATYDLQPEMAAPEVTDKLIEAIDAGTYDLIVVNYANTDMVGHSGNMDAATKAVEAVDTCVGRVHEAVKRAGGVLLITADHGNCEQMRDPETGQPHTAHTLNSVPFVVAGQGFTTSTPLRNGQLADIAPTILHLMGLAQPATMTGKPLIATET